MGFLFCDTSVLFVIIFLTNLTSLKAAIRCYKCSMTPPNLYFNETKRMCADFDYSDTFIVDCQYSTLCMKKTFTVNLTNPINGTIRDCADQKYETQQYRNGKWQQEVSIEEEAFTEGCQTPNTKGQRNSKTEYCFCKGDLCNTAVVTGTPNTAMPAISVMFVLSVGYNIGL